MKELIGVHSLELETGMTIIVSPFGPHAVLPFFLAQYRTEYNTFTRTETAKGGYNR